MRQLLTVTRDRLARAAYHRVLRKASQKPNSPCVRRVLGLLQLIQETERLRLELYKRCKSQSDDPATFPKYEEETALGVFSDPEQQTLNLAFHDGLKNLNKKMQRYRWSPTIRAGDFLSLQQVFTWPGRRDGEMFWENFAVFWLMGHVSGSLLSPAPILRFRQCRQCSAWFYALTDHQLQCSSRCRQKFHANSPEFRAKRAAYMREQYRPQEKQRAQRQKRLAGIRTGTRKRED
jgi:hypothetical protein